MRQTLSDLQTAFFTKNGYIEFEMAHPLPPLSSERDQWRDEEGLKTFFIKTLGPIGLVLTGKKQLRLSLSFWITKENRPQKSGLLKDLISIQSLALAICMAPHPHLPTKRSPLGILPVPTSRENILFFKPNLILDWPHVSSDLFLTLFTFPNTVYVHNPKDPETTYLQSFGYEYGDLLKAETHPLILQA